MSAVKFILLCTFFASTSSFNGGFIFTAPKIFLSGYDANVCLSFKDEFGPARVKVTILEQKDDIEITSALVEISEEEKSGKCFKVSMPRTEITKGRLRLSINFKTDGDFNTNYMEQILIQTNPDVTFIETDKPVYNSGQLLKFIIFTLKPDLTPVIEPVNEIWIENPSGIRIKQWLNVSTIQGFINETFQLSDESRPGKWMIKLKREETEVIAKSFMVENYILPRFSVKIIAPDYMNSTENITICANYVFGEPVHGKVILQFFVKCSFSFYCQEKGASVTEHLRLNKNGCKDHRIVLRNLSLFSQFLVINATVIEDGTQFRAQTLAKVTIKNVKQKNLEFAPEIRKKKFKPGLPFKGEIILKTKPKLNDMVFVCLNSNELQSCKELYVNNNRTKFIIMPFPIRDEKNFKISVEVHNSRDSFQKGSYITKLNLLPWYSPSGSYIQLENLSGQPLLCGEEAKFNALYSSTDSEIQFHYMVKARGNILTKGLLNKFSDKAKRLRLEKEENLINRGDIKKIMQFEFKISISSIMSPYSYLIVYFIRSDGEVVADTLIFEVEKCLPNWVKSNWEKQKLEPGSSNNLIVESTSRSICALAVTDQSVKLLSPKSNFKIERVFNEIGKFEVKPTIFENNSNHCKNKAGTIINATDEMEALSEPRQMDSQFVDTLQAFNDFGVLVITDLVFETRPCRENVRNEGSINATTRNSKINIYGKEVENIELFKSEEFLNEVDNFKEYSSDYGLRTFFPETWVWDFIQINDSGTAKLSFKVPHTITEWATDVICLSKDNGLGIADQSKFITYQPFFLDFYVPHSLKRKEIFHLLVTVFNFQNNYLPVKITYMPSASFFSKSEEFKSYCIKPRSKVVHRLILEALKLGQTEIKVKAEVDINFNRNCGNASLVKSDLVIKKLLITHEGFPMEEVRSGFICSGNSNFTNQVTWNIKIPVEAIESSISINALVSGNILGPPLKNIDKLISLPTGCGEQNMIHLVPNILLLDYLLHTTSKDLTIVEKALKNLDLGYQRQLNYKLHDGSYSAFGEKDEKGSIWLTAFVIRYLSQAKKYIYIDEQDLNNSVAWILKHQLENGCFPLIGKIYHRKLQEKLMDEESSKTVTAYILISLIESGIPIDDRVVKNAIFCLKPNEESLGMYGDLVSSYALILSGNYRDAQALMITLLKEAKRSYGLLWWENEDSTESVIEMTSYGILTLIKLGGPHFMAAASDAIRWILQFQNQNGGFLSSQDTVVALEAISKFSATVPQANKYEHLIVKATANGKKYSFNITEEDRLIQKKVKLPSFLTDLFFESSGKGCALVQTALTYNTRRGRSINDLKLQLKIHSVSNIDLCSIARFSICVKNKSQKNEINMAVLEVSMVSGYYPDRASLFEINTSSRGVKRWEEYEDKVNFYFENLRNKKVCVDFLVVREIFVENAAPAFIKIYDYYNSHIQTTLKYNLMPECQNESWSETSSTQIKNESKRELRSQMDGFFFADENFENFENFDNFEGFKNIEEDLETPPDFEGAVPVYALPPNKEADGQRSCVHCLKTIPDIFPQLYCSSALAIKALIVGKEIFQFQLDVSPQSNFTSLNNSVSFTIQEKCDCPILNSINSFALMLVTPPRVFSIQHVLEIHLDDSIQLYQWGDSHDLPNYLTDAIKFCQKWPFNDNYRKK